MTNCCNISLSVTDCIPTIENFNEAHPQLFEILFQDFKKTVQFALIEILELDRTISIAKTWVYFEEDDAAFKILVKDYFSKIDTLFDKKSFSLSSADPFYFNSPIFFSRITNPEINANSNFSCNWHGPIKHGFDRDYHSRNPVPTDDLQQAYNDYVKELSKSILKPYPAAYVLLVPVVLNHRDSNFQRKIGAVFLHFGLSEPLQEAQEKNFAIEAFRNINLCWHYALTAESLYKRIEDIKKAEAKASMDKAVYDQYIEDVVAAREKLLGAVDDLDLSISPSHKDKANKSLLSLKKITGKCFPAHGNEHDPYGHTNLDKLLEVKQDLLFWIEKFNEHISSDEFMKTSCCTERFMEPIQSVLSNGNPGGNNGDNPHPALCLAKCISSGRIPLAWLLLVLKSDATNDDTWRLYSEFSVPDTSSSFLEVLYPLAICTNKLNLSYDSIVFSSLNGQPCLVCVTCCPGWESSYNALYNSIMAEIAAPEGGTTRALNKLNAHNFELKLNKPNNTEEYTVSSCTDSCRNKVTLSESKAIFEFTVKKELCCSDVDRDRSGEG